MKCLCGCGQEVKLGNKFISGHNSRIKEYIGGQFKKGHTITVEIQTKINEAKKDYKHSEETKEKIRKGNEGKIVSEKTRKILSELNSGEKHPKFKGGCNDYWYEKAWKLFGYDCCENCYMSNEDHKQKWKHRLEMHNTLDPKDYTIMESEVWMTLCKICHTGLEATLKNNKILDRKWGII